ncbi:MAG: T9SS type A sorting domain-containing protein [Weeksellaceae bacterium]
MKKTILFTLIFFHGMLLLAQNPDANNTLFVNQNVAGGDNSGESWENAIPELADALKWARENQNSGIWSANNPLKIWVAEGTYKPLYNAADGQYSQNGDRDNAFVMVKNVQIYGGFSGTETSIEERDWENNPTILSGNIGAENNSLDNTYHIVISAGNVQQALLDGFTLTEGRGDGSIFGGPVVNGLEINEGGGAINTRSSAPLFRNLIIDNNLGYWGGQIFNYQSSPTFENVQITNGWSFWGGGVHNRGSNPVFNNVYFANNYGDLAGGGMYNVEFGNPVLNDVTFYQNTTGSDGQGGGIYSYVKVNLALKNVSFIENQAGVAGGGIGYVADGVNQDVVFQNCLFVGNRTNGHGGGVLFFDAQEGGITFKIENSTFYDNEGDTGASLGIWYDQQTNGVPVEINNSIFWENATLISGAANPTFVINNTLLEDDECPSNKECNNVVFNEEPLFFDVENSDFSLTEHSPAINAGNNALFTGLDENSLDLAGNPRVYGYGQGGTIDMGAYEFQGGDLNLNDLHSAKIQIYPNPVNRGTVLNISGMDEPSGKISLYDLTGKRILQKDSILKQIQIPGNILQGVYILKYENGKQSKSVKLIVK